MAKIIKVASSTNTPRIASQFKTSRNTTTNPFKYQNFEGNTLDISAFADVFESTTSKETNKMRLIASSVAGSMHKIRSSITEPIAKFVGKVREAWNYAKNINISDAVKGLSGILSTQVEIPGLKTIDEIIHKPIDISGITSGYSAVKDGIVGLGKEIGSGWTALISKVNSGSKISADLSVAELEELFKSELSASVIKEAA